MAVTDINEVVIHQYLSTLDSVLTRQLTRQLTTGVVGNMYDILDDILYDPLYEQVSVHFSEKLQDLGLENE